MRQTAWVSDLAAVLFDMDGTLVETESLWHQAEIATMAQFGHEWTDEEQLFALGGPFENVVAYMATKSGAEPTAIADVLAQSIESLMLSSSLPTQPGVRELHDQARAAGLPVGLVTNSFRTLVDLVLESTGLHFDVVVAGDEVDANKPHPLPYQRACQLLGVSPQSTVVLEDSTTGIESARAAGCWVVAIPHQVEVPQSERVLQVRSVAGISLDDLQQWVSAPPRPDH